MEHIYEPLNNIIFSIGGISVTWYAALIMTGALIGLFIAGLNAKKLGLNKSFLSDAFVYGLVIGILGARLYYVLFSLENYIDEPLKIFAIHEGGLAIHGGVIAASIYMYFFCKKRKLNIFKIVEIVFPVLLLAQAIGRWGNFMNQEAFGPMIAGTADQGRIFLSQTLHLPEFIVNQMYLYGPNELGYYHPTFLYESIFNIVGFILIYFGLRKLKNYYVGDSFSFYLIWYGIVRFFIESLRTDALMLGPIKVAQLLSILMILAGIAIKYYRVSKKVYPLSYKDAIAGEEMSYNILGLTNEEEYFNKKNNITVSVSKFTETKEETKKQEMKVNVKVESTTEVVEDAKTVEDLKEEEDQDNE